MNKKGDMMDLLLQNEKFIADNNKASIVYEYPEPVIKILDKFLSVWKLPHNAVPTKKNKSQYSQWIMELQDLDSLCSKNMVAIMDRAYLEYVSGKMNFMVTHPSAIRKLIIDAVARISREESFMVTTAVGISNNDTASEVTPASREKLIKTSKDLKSFLKDGE
jgi:hypothetical protein